MMIITRLYYFTDSSFLLRLYMTIYVARTQTNKDKQIFPSWRLPYIFHNSLEPHSSIVSARVASCQQTPYPSGTNHCHHIGRLQFWCCHIVAKCCSKATLQMSTWLTWGGGTCGPEFKLPLGDWINKYMYVNYFTCVHHLTKVVVRFVKNNITWRKHH